MQAKVNNISYIYNHKKFNEYKALDEVSLNIEKGDFVAIVGKTGSGKSTLIQTFNGLLLPTINYVQIDDFVITSDKKLKKQLLKDKTKEIKKENKKSFLLRKKVGIVFQFPEYQLFEENVLKDVKFGPKNFKIPDEECEIKAKKALNSVGIDESYYNRSPFELSGGEKRRVAIAGVLASEPEILILDEPTAGLDPFGKKEIMDVIKEVSNNGTTIIFVTHDMDIVMNYAKKVFILEDGKLIKETTPNELFNDPNINDYSLEIPMFYKFRNLLKDRGFAGNFDEIHDFSSLISLLSGDKND